MIKENQELTKLLEKIGREKYSLENEYKDALEKIDKNNENQKNINQINEMNFNDLTEIQLLSNMILLFSKYKNNELDEKNCMIIEKYLKESQKDFFQKMENSIEEYRQKCFGYLENLKEKVH